MNNDDLEKISVTSLNEYESLLTHFEKYLRTAKATIKFLPDVQSQYREKVDKQIHETYLKLSSDEKKQIKDATNAMKGHADTVRKGSGIISGKVFLTSRNVEIILSKTMDRVQLPKQIESYIHESSLVYLITAFEVFLKDNLKLVFKNEPGKLKTGREMKHAEILKTSSLKELKNKILEKEVNELISNDIDKLGKKLAEEFKVHLTKTDDWEDFTERFYRRHVIVHNNSVPDDKYRSETKLNVMTFETDQKYILKSISLFQKYADIISESFQKHFSRIQE
jgi:IS1 family transposase